MLSFATVSSTQSSTSQLRTDELRWARKVGLPQSTVSAIVKAAGISEDDEVRIENLDAHHLMHRNHVLLVTAAGNGHCLTLDVVEHGKNSVKKVWEVSEAPDGSGFCHTGAHSGDFKAYAAADGRIILDVPKDKDGHYVLDGIRRLIYTWNGGTYVATEDLVH
jgi:hypothetical protein